MSLELAAANLQTAYLIRDGSTRLDELSKSADPAGRALIERFQAETPLGIGGEKVVYSYDDDRVIAFVSPRHKEGYDHSSESLKANFYARKIAHLLFPESFPNISFVGSSPPVLIMEKVQPQEPPRTGTFSSFLQERKHEQLVAQFIDQANERGLIIDHNVQNYLYGQSGNLVYVDDIVGVNGKRVREVIKHLTEPQQIAANRWLNRLIALRQIRAQT